MTLFIDRRERLLSEALDCFPHDIKDLPIGDAVCEYDDEGQWVAERKTVCDLASSIKSGRWQEQVSRLHEGYHTIYFLIEGDLRNDAGIPYHSLWSTLLNAELRENSHVIRTLSVQETALVIRHLVQRGLQTPGIPTGLAPKRVLTKRKKDADKKTVFIRQMMTIPSISEHVATKLFEHFSGTLPQLQKALAPDAVFPEIRLNSKTKIGKDRVEKLARHLL